jgi:protein-tyrosine phosphatase
LSDPTFKYLTFPIGRWRSHVSPAPPAVLAFFSPLFTFLDLELALGNNVLIHCLAGAHRAGTAGIASLMHLCGMGRDEATTAAKKLRPAINPIGDFPKLLMLLDRGMREGGGGG